MPSNRSWLSSELSGTRSGERGFEGVDVVDALAGERALAQQVLVDVGYRGGVRIDAGGAGERALERRRLGAHRQREGDARLQDGVALDHAAELPRRSAGD